MDNDMSMLEKVEFYEKTYGPIIKERGLKNWKNLFKKPTFQDWIILAMLIIMLFSAYAYQNDIKICREYIKEQNQYDLGNFLDQPAVGFNFTTIPLLPIKEEKQLNSGEG